MMFRLMTRAARSAPSRVTITTASKPNSQLRSLLRHTHTLESGITANKATTADGSRRFLSVGSTTPDDVETPEDVGTSSPDDIGTEDDATSSESDSEESPEEAEDAEETEDAMEEPEATEATDAQPPAEPNLKVHLRPKAVVDSLNQHIVGQQDAKRAVAIAMRNRWRRRQLPKDLMKEVTPRNVLMIGPTGCGKTEVARRMAALSDAPFLKVCSLPY